MKWMKSQHTNKKFINIMMWNGVMTDKYYVLALYLLYVYIAFYYER